MRTSSIIVAVLISASSLTASQRRDERIPLFIGPPMRDGFVETDAGVRDSVKDIQNALRSSRVLRLVQKPEEATVVLTIVARSMAGDAGAVGIPIAGFVMLAPIHGRSIQWTLRVNAYETTRISEDRERGTCYWAARAVRADVVAWVEANRHVLTAQAPDPARRED